MTGEVSIWLPPRPASVPPELWELLTAEDSPLLDYWRALQARRAFSLISGGMTPGVTQMMDFATSRLPGGTASGAAASEDASNPEVPGP